MSESPGSNQNYPLKAVLEIVVKLSIFSLLFYAIYKQVFQNKDMSDVLESLHLGIGSMGWILFALVFLLMFVNWGLEALKWQRLINKVERISFVKSMLAIFSGVTFTLFTPNRMGEYGGRLIFLKSPFHADPLMATVLGSMSQIIVTLVLGLIGFCFTGNDFFNNIKYPDTIPVIAMVAVAGIGIFYFQFDFFYARLSKIAEGFNYKLKLFLHYSKAELSVTLLISFLRYLVYSIQYLLLLEAFGIPVFDFNGFWTVASIFLTQTIIPSIAILDLGIRGNVALWFFKDAGSEASVVAAAFTLWLVNLILPALIGYVVILSTRIFKR